MQNAQGSSTAFTAESYRHLRHSYTNKLKYLLLTDIEVAESRLKARLYFDDAMFVVSVLNIVNRTSWVTINTTMNWLKRKRPLPLLMISISGKGGSNTEAVGGMRFLKSATKTTEKVRHRRKDGKLVSMALVLKNLKAEAEKENAEAFDKCKWSAELISNFLWRNGFG